MYFVNSFPGVYNSQETVIVDHDRLVHLARNGSLSIRTMKNLSIALILLTGFVLTDSANAQVTTSAIRANFGVDGDLNANYFDGAVLAGSDDWFRNSGSTGDYMIDTTG